MKPFLLLPLVAAALVAGCSGTKPASGSPPGHAAPVKEAPVILPVTRPIGRIASVNLVSRFVVVTYPTTQLPPDGRRLGIYRDGRKLGEVKVTGFKQETFAAADLLSGEAQVGDEIRDN